MRRGIAFTGAVLIAIVSTALAEETTIEDVFQFPEVYVGKKLEFDMAELSSDFKNDKEFYCLEVTSRGGEKVAPALKRPGITFIVEGDLLKKLLDTVQFDQVYPVKLTCLIARERILGNTFFLADIREIGFYGAEGTIVETVTARESVTETAGPAGQVIGDEILEEVIDAYQPDGTVEKPVL